MSVILGIDPGSRVTGFGVIQVVGKQCQYVASGCIRVDVSASIALRLSEIYQGLQNIITQYTPTEAAIEQVFVCHNVTSALKLGQARGVAMVALGNQGLTVGEYSARQVKQAVVGYGGAEKKQVQEMVRVLLGLSHSPPSDAADALAIALCHHHTQRFIGRGNWQS